MIRLILFLLICFPQIIIAQVDEIILPELELTIEDESALNTYSSENAVIKERTPQFQEVYLEELHSGVADSFINLPITQKNNYRLSYIQVLYGSFNNIQAQAYAQNSFKNLFYKLSYEGQYRENSFNNGRENKNSSLYNNTVLADFSIDLTNIIIDIGIGYQQDQISLHNMNNNQFVNYVPINVHTKYWVNDKSYLNFDTSFGFLSSSYQDLQGVQAKDTTLIDGSLDLSYVAKMVEWNTFTVQAIYNINDYPASLVHTGEVTAISEFFMAKGVTIDVGFTVVGSSFTSVFGWPEIALKYNYLDVVNLVFKLSGDYNLYDTYLASQEQQIFSYTPAPESHWTYSALLQVVPSPYFWLATIISYNDYKNKRIYTFDDNTSLYAFESIDRVGMFVSSIELGIKVPNIFDLTTIYTYQGIQKNWLLYTPHKWDIIVNLGYKPVGFNFETHYILYAPRNLTDNINGSMIHLLNMRISQKIYHIAEVFVEVKNILNQDIQFTSETFYGGIQANGGIKVNF